MRRLSMILVSIPFALGCGGADAPAAEPESTSAGAEAPPAPAADSPPAEDHAEADEPRPSETLTALLGDPELTVYAVGPRALEPTPITAGEAAPFAAELRVINEGGGPAELEQAELRFEVVSEDGAREMCTSADDSTPPSALEEGATIVRAVARCSFPAAGEYEVRLYAAFEADQLDVGHDLERYFAGRTEVVVR